MFRAFFPPKAAELEIRKGVKNGEYSCVRVRVASLKKKDLPDLLIVLNQVAQHVSQD